MKIYKIKESSHKVINNDKEQYVSDGFSDAEEISLEDLECMGLHFTPQENSPSISATGLRPQIGSNSSGGLGREAIEKTFFSNGIDGFMQIFNRTIQAVGEVELGTLQKDTEKREHLTVLQRNSPKSDESLSVIEAFEYARRYMADNRYFAFDIVEPLYEKQIDEEKIDEQVASVNASLDSIEGISVNIDNLSTEEISGLIKVAFANIQELKKKVSDVNKELEEKLASKSRIGQEDLTSEKSEKNLIKKDDTNSKKDEEIAKLERKKIKNESKITGLDKLKASLENRENGKLTIDSPKSTIEGINTLIDTLKEQSKSLGPVEKAEKKRIMEELNKARATISIELRRKSKQIIDKEIRGKAKPESLIYANFERIDYNEDAVAWVDFQKHPHNCHTLVLDQEYEIDGITEPRGVKLNSSDLSLISLDGKNPASCLDFARVMYENLPEERRENFAMDVPDRIKDGMIIGKFFEYVNLYENSRNAPEEFIEKALQLQSEVMESFPHFGTEATAEELRIFQTGISDERASSNKQQEDFIPQ